MKNSSTNRLKKNDMAIKTAVKPRGPSLPSKRPLSSLFEIGKAISKSAGFYREYELWRYDPDYLYKKTIGKYTYKPRKRITGHALQTRGFLKKTPFSNSKFGKTYRRRNLRYNVYNSAICHSKSGYCSQ